MKARYSDWAKLVPPPVAPPPVDYEFDLDCDSTPAELIFEPRNTGRAPTASAQMKDRRRFVLGGGTSCDVEVTWSSAGVVVFWTVVGPLPAGAVWLGFLKTSRSEAFLWIDLGPSRPLKQHLKIPVADLGFDPTTSQFLIEIHVGI